MRTDWHALELTKTCGWEPRDRTDDELVDYGGLVSWCERRGLLSRGLARQYRQRARGRPPLASAAATRARALRGLIYRLPRAIATGRAPTDEQMHELTGWLRRYADARELAVTGTGIIWDWRLNQERVDHVLAPVAWSMADLLIAPELGRVRLCDGDDCGRLFVDGSRGGARRWCDMSDCGNRAKVNRFRARHNVRS